MRRKTAITLVLGLTALLTASSVFAHHSFAPVFDADKVVSLKGVITRFEWVNPHSFIFVETKGASGAVEHWALEGPPPTQLTRMNFDKSSLKVGDPIEFCGYATRDGIEPIKSVSASEPISLSLKSMPREVSSGRVINTELLTFPDGRSMVWQNYGHRKCRDAHNL